MANPMMVIDGDGHVIEVNETYERIDPKYRERRPIYTQVSRGNIVRLVDGKVWGPDTECGFVGVNGNLPAPHGKAIRFGLAAIKNVGASAIESIVTTREKVGRFSTLGDFCARVDLRLVNRRVVESLIKAGAFDSTGARRAQLAAVLDRTVDQASAAQRITSLAPDGLNKVFFTNGGTEAIDSTLLMTVGLA